jgi:hypothetical protein
MLIKDENLKKALLKALADDEASKILASTVGKPKSVVDITRECGIAHTSAYRLVNALRQSGVLVVERTALTPDGKKFAMYKSAYRSINVSFDHGAVEVQADQNVIEKAFKLFFSLSDENGDAKQ